MKPLRIQLEELHAYEHEQGLRNAKACAPGDVVENIRALYQDRVYIGAAAPAFHRPGAPLHALPLLAQQTVVLVPPVSRDQLTKVLGGTPPELLFALPKDRVIPVISWPRDYDTPECAYLEPLLRTNPISMPVRGYALVHGMGRDELFARARADHRVTDLATLPVMQERWAAEFPHVRNDENALHERVVAELTNNYVDLSIFGYEGLLEEILEELDPLHRATRLLRTAELLTYPSLIGMDGQAQYRRVRPTDTVAIPEIDPGILTAEYPVIQAILDGIDVNLAPLASNPEQYAIVLQHLYDRGVIAKIASIHQQLVTAIAAAREPADAEANNEALRLINELTLAKGEIADRAKLVPTDAQVKMYVGAGIAMLGPLASAIAALLTEIGFQHLLLLTTISVTAGAAAKEAEGFRNWIRDRIAQSVFEQRWSFDLWQIRDTLSSK